jgi:Rps23 Pro-64 3,4-dihydroxylase Tpa1-like proline 4-hydroxylase
MYTLNYSFYIHDNWKDDWGGETLIDTGRGLPLASYPLSNTLLAIKNNILHKVCPVTGPVKRKVLQVRGIFYE